MCKFKFRIVKISVEFQSCKYQKPIPYLFTSWKNKISFYRLVAISQLSKY